jgi:hypothetical protein
MTRNLNGEPKMMSLETWREFVNEKIRLMKEDADNTEILINFLNTYNLVTINDFEIQSICGKGGFATVYKALHVSTLRIESCQKARNHSQEPIRVCPP